MERHLQICNGLVWPVGVFDLVQLGLGEDFIEVLDGHLVEGDHVVELGQLVADRRTDRPITTCFPVNYFLSRQEAEQLPMESELG